MGEKIYSKKHSSIEFSNITINTDQCGWLVAGYRGKYFLLKYYKTLLLNNVFSGTWREVSSFITYLLGTQQL